MPKKAKNSTCICDHKDITASQRVPSVETERNCEKDRTGRRKDRKTETEREAQQGGWNTITAL